jgi:hypothetical protein
LGLGYLCFDRSCPNIFLNFFPGKRKKLSQYSNGSDAMEELKSKVLLFIEENQSFEGILSEVRVLRLIGS